MSKQRIFIAGHRGMVGSAIRRQLEQRGDVELVLRTRDELNLLDSRAVHDFFASERIDQVYLAAAKVGGIVANNTYPADFIYQNMMIESNIIHAAHQNDVNKLLFLGSSCIYPKLSEYSVIQTKEPLDREGKVSRIVEFIEKPDQPQTLDSDIMAVGRYVLSADIWPELERTQPGAWGRIQLTDAIAELAKKQSVDAMLMTGDSYDCGKKMGYMQAFVKYGLRNLKEGAKFRKGIEKLLSE